MYYWYGSSAACKGSIAGHIEPARYVLLVWQFRCMQGINCWAYRASQICIAGMAGPLHARDQLLGISGQPDMYCWYGRAAACKGSITGHIGPARYVLLVWQGGCMQRINCWAYRASQICITGMAGRLHAKDQLLGISGQPDMYYWYGR